MPDNRRHDRCRSGEVRTRLPDNRRSSFSRKKARDAQHLPPSVLRLRLRGKQRQKMAGLPCAPRPPGPKRHRLRGKGPPERQWAHGAAMLGVGMDYKTRMSDNEYFDLCKITIEDHPIRLPRNPATSSPTIWLPHHLPSREFSPPRDMCNAHMEQIQPGWQGCVAGESLLPHWRFDGERCLRPALQYLV